MDAVLLGFKAVDTLIAVLLWTGWLVSGLPLPSLPEPPAAVHDPATVERALLPVDEDW